MAMNKAKYLQVNHQSNTHDKLYVTNGIHIDFGVADVACGHHTEGRVSWVKDRNMA